MTNAIIHGFEVDKLTDNVKSVTFLRGDGTLQTLNDENVTISGSFTENGTYSPPSGTIGFDSIEINVPPSGKVESVDVTLNREAQTIRPSVGFDGIGVVNVPKSTLTSLSASLTPNMKTYTSADDGFFGYSSVSVPGYSSLMVDLTLEDLADADIQLGYSQIITPETIYGAGTQYKAFTSFVLPSAILQAKSVTPSTSERTIQPTDGAYGLSSVTVESALTVMESLTATSNGSYSPSIGNIGFSDVTVNVDLHLEPQRTVTSNGLIEPAEGYNGLSSVQVNVQPSEVKWIKPTTYYDSDSGPVIMFMSDGDVVKGNTTSMMTAVKYILVFSGGSTPEYYVLRGYEENFATWTGLDVTQDPTHQAIFMLIEGTPEYLTVGTVDGVTHMFENFDYLNPKQDKTGLGMLVNP